MVEGKGGLGWEGQRGKEVKGYSYKMSEGYRAW